MSLSPDRAEAHFLKKATGIHIYANSRIFFHPLNVLKLEFSAYHLFLI